MTDVAASAGSPPGRRPSLLILNLFMVHPPNTGAKIVIWNRIVELTRWFEITFCCLDEGPVAAASLQALERHCRVVQIVPQAGARARLLLDALVDPSVRLFAPALRAWLSGPDFAALAVESFDLIEVHSSCWFRREIARLKGLKVLVAHNDEVEYWRGQAAARSDRRPWSARWGARFDALQASRQQGRAVVAADAVVVLSVADRERLRARVGARPMLANPGGIDCSAYAEVANTQPVGPPCLVFVGALFVDGVAAAADLFARTVLPRLRRTTAGLGLILVGDHRDHPVVMALQACPGVQLTGAVDDVRPHLAGATIVVVPLLHGSGIRFKLLEACAAGRAIVATRASAEGAGLVDGEHACLVDNVGDMAAPIEVLLADPEARAALGGRARQFALQNFDRGQHHAALAAWYRQLLGRDA